MLDSRRCIASFVLGLGVLTFLCAPAIADVGRPAPAYRLRLDLDLSIALVGGAVTSSFLVLDEASGVTCATACDRSRINFLDRPAAGLYSAAWNRVGNVAVAGTEDRERAPRSHRSGLRPGGGSDG